MAHACNPSYSAGRDQKDYSWKAAPWANSSGDPILKKEKKNHIKKCWLSGSSCQEKQKQKLQSSDSI
jgi:hypothetical protein